MRHLSSRLITLPAILILSVLLGFGLLVATRALPSTVIERNIARDINVLEEEGLYPRLAGDTLSNIQDNFTDALILSLAMPVDDMSATEQAAKSAFWEQGDDPIVSLAMRLSLRPTNANNNYFLYWQGHVIIMRILLLLFSYTQIRVLNGVLLGLGSLILCALLWYRLGAKVALALLVSTLPLAPLTIFRSIQFVNTFFLALDGALMVILLFTQFKHTRFDAEVFLVLGIATAYFDFLTTPLITWGIPVLVLCASIIHRDEKEGDRRSASQTALELLRSIVRTALAWISGYVLMWAAKWAIASQVLGSSVFEKALGKLSERTGESMTFTERMAGALKNVALLSSPAMLTDTTWRIPMIVVAALVLIWFVVWLVTRSGFDRMVRALPILLVGLAPYVWYLVVSNHSSIHASFVYRVQWISILALLMFMVLTISTRSLQPKGRHARRTHLCSIGS